MDKDLVFHTNADKGWFHDKYWYNGANGRFHTFQIALNLLQQWHPLPVILETGCQRQTPDIGGGMSTSIFAEYIYKYGGKLITVDNNQEHLNRAYAYVARFGNSVDVDFVCSNSVGYLQTYYNNCNLLYLDSLDYPLDGNRQEGELAEDHCVQEFLAIEARLKNKTILLIDDNLVADILGGKPAKVRHLLADHKDWTCLFEMQQTLWVKGL